MRYDASLFGLTSVFQIFHDLTKSGHSTDVEHFFVQSYKAGGSNFDDLHIQSLFGISRADSNPLGVRFECNDGQSVNLKMS